MTDLKGKTDEEFFPEEAKIRWRQGLWNRLRAEGKKYEHHEIKDQRLAINSSKDILGVHIESF